MGAEVTLRRLQPCGNPMSDSTQSGFGTTHCFPPVSAIESAPGRSSPRHVPVGRLPFQSLAADVGHIAPPSDNEHPLASMRSSNTGSSQREPDSIKPAGGKVSEYGGEGRLLDDSPGALVSMRRPCSGDILPDDDAWANLLDEPPLLAPQTASLTFEASALPKIREIGTGGASVEDVDMGRDEGATDSSGSHVIVSKSVGPSFCEGAQAVRVSFDLEGRFDIESVVPQGGLDAEVEAADAGEEASDFRRVRAHRRDSNIDSAPGGRSGSAKSRSASSSSPTKGARLFEARMDANPSPFRSS